jgi:hypothetical protein
MGTVEAADSHGFEFGGSSLPFYRVAGKDVLLCPSDCSGHVSIPANEHVTMAMTHYHDEMVLKLASTGWTPCGNNITATKEW